MTGTKGEQRQTAPGVCAPGSCMFCGCTFRKPSDVMNHRCAAMQEAIDTLGAAANPAAPTTPITGGLIQRRCPHCGRETGL